MNKVWKSLAAMRPQVRGRDGNQFEVSPVQPRVTAWYIQPAL